MSRKKSRQNPSRAQTASGADKPSSPNAAAPLPNRPPSTGLLKADNEPEDQDHDGDWDDATDDPGELELDEIVRIPDPAPPATKSGVSNPPNKPATDKTATNKTATNKTAGRSSGSSMAIVADGVAKTYGDLPALAPLDLSVETGERVALIGHNGSGKTTFIKMVCGLLEPSDGSIEVFGSPPGSMTARRALSYLSDQPVFYDDLSLIEHIEYVARLHGVDEWLPRGEELLERFQLGERRDDLPMTFSRGLKQKASICLAFVRPFDLLVVDEPFVGLDSRGRTTLLELMAEHHGRGATLVVATHELSTVGASDRVVALRSGEVAYDGGGEADLDTLVDNSVDGSA